MNVAIVGCGHGGSALAAVLAMHGHQVGMVKLGRVLHNPHFSTLVQRRTIRLLGIEGEGEFPLAKVSAAPAEVIPDADVVLVYYVSNYHPMVAERLAPHLHAGQCVVLGPGYMGSLLFERALRAQGTRDLPLFAEFETLPYSSRVTEPGTVRISSRNVRHPYASYPASRASEVSQRLAPVVGTCIPRQHLLEVTLHNPNLIIHTTGMLMNVSRVEGEARDYSMYRQGFTPSLWNLVATLDAEKMDVLARTGVPRRTYFDEFLLRTFEDTNIAPLDGFSRYAAETRAVLTTLDHRYITEDVPMGLGLLHSAGELGGVATPICTSLMHLANALLPQHDFWREARTIPALWDGSLDALLDRLTR